jgi:hypothetical protein
MTDISPNPIDNPIPVMYCADHPDIETGLRCKRCDKPICAKCAVRTPTGYLCKECVRLQQKVFDTAKGYDYPIVFFLTGILSGIGSLIATRLGFFVILIAPVVGVIIAEVVRAVVRRRRSKRLFLLVAISTVLGGLPMLGLSILLGDLWGVLLQAVYVFAAATTAYQRLWGINIG